mgnify:CR=1 FL=1
MHSSAHLLRAAGLALALALVPAAPAANVVLWNFDISTTGNDVFWDSTHTWTIATGVSGGTLARCLDESDASFPG